jgi:eukaryotic-like serine/threonine-protein kinase
LLEEVRAGAPRRWIQIEGPSGSGKSSLVQAGVLPRLRDHPSATERWIIATIRPSEDPIKSLAAAVVAAYSTHGLATSPAELETALRSDGVALDALLSRHNPEGVKLLLVVEQLEELFALGGAHLRQFDALLSRSLTRATSPLRLLTTLRSDYIHRLEQAPGLAQMLNDTASRYYLRPMGEEALAEVISGMAARAGLPLSKGLAERMVRDASGTDDRLPLLGHALRSLWSSNATAALTDQHYEQVGGVSGALARQAALLLDSLGEDGRERAKWLILDLVQVGRGTPDTRRPRSREQVLAAAGGDRLAEEVLLRLSGISIGQPVDAPENLRLVMVAAEHPADPSRQRVDLVHETLLQRVPTLVGWIDDERAFLERHADLEAAAHAWEQSECPVDGLPSGSLLDHYRGSLGDVRQRERVMRMASERGRTFVRSAERLVHRHLWRRRALGALLFAVAMAISATTLWAWTERDRAEENRQRILEATAEEVGERDWKLGRILYTTDIRQKTLAQIDERLSSLPEDEQDRSDVLDAVVMTKQRRSDLARSNGRLSESSEFVSQAEQRIQFGLSRETSNDQLLMKLAWNHSKRGKIELAYGRHEAARDDFARSVAVLMRIRPVEMNEYRRTLATSYSEQADVELELGDAPAAAALYEEAIGLLEQINEPDESGQRYNLALIALASSMRGEALRRSGDLAAAATSLEEARKTEELAVRADTGNAMFCWTLGRIYAALAEVRAEEGKPAEKSSLYDHAAGIGEELMRGDPTRKDYGLLLCESLQGVEAAADERGDVQRAASAYARRCQVARAFAERDPEDARFRHLTCP